MHLLVHEDGAERGAPLTAECESREDRALDGEIEVRIRHHHERVLAPELEARALQMAAAELADAPSHGSRAGEAHLVDEFLLEGGFQPGRGGRAVGVNDLQDAAGEPGVHEERRERVGERRRVLGRLPHDGVAADERRDDVPGGHRHREVPRGDDERHPDGHPEGEELLALHLARHRLPVQAPAFTEEEVALVDDLLHLAERLDVRLADLACEQAGEGLLVGLHEAAGLLDDPGSTGGGVAAHAVCTARRRCTRPPPRPAPPARPRRPRHRRWRGSSRRRSGRRACGRAFPR